MKKYLAALAVLGIAAVAAAAPLYTYTCNPLGGGLYGHSFTVDNTGQPTSAWFVEMEWHGASGAEVLVAPGTLINQVKVFGAVVVHEEPDAISYHDPTPPANYDMNLDTWVRAEFSFAFQGGTPIEGPNSYNVQSGTDAGATFITAPHAYIVSDGDVAFSGRLGVGAGTPVWEPVSGTSPVPEPATLLLLGLGGLGAIIRRRR